MWIRIRIFSLYLKCYVDSLSDIQYSENSCISNSFYIFCRLGLSSCARSSMSNIDTFKTLLPPPYFELIKSSMKLTFSSYPDYSLSSNIYLFLSKIYSACVSNFPIFSHRWFICPQSLFKNLFQLAKSSLSLANSHSCSMERALYLHLLIKALMELSTITNQR